MKFKPSLRYGNVYGDGDVRDTNVDDKDETFACTEDEILEMDLVLPYSSPVYST